MPLPVRNGVCRKLTPFGQEVTFTASPAGTSIMRATCRRRRWQAIEVTPGGRSRFVSALAIDVKWPFIGDFLGGTQRLTPRVQIVGSPKTDNNAVPNEDSRAVDLTDSNLFALSRYPGYDRFEDSSRVTYGARLGGRFAGILARLQYRPELPAR